MDNYPNVRWSALEILCRIEKEESFSSSLLPIYEERVNPKDRGLLHEIVLGTIRKTFYLNSIIEKLTGKKIGKLDLEVAVALRIGLYQLLFLDKIPASAAVNESVKLVQRAKKTSAKGLVNAVLRKAANELPDPLAGISDEIERLSTETSHPRWLIEKWKAQFGFDQTAALCRANNTSPGIVFRLTAKSDSKTLGVLMESGLEITKSEIVEGAYRATRSNEKLRQLANDGKIYFQDEASQLLCSLIDLKEGDRFLDVCAAPGSKTTLIGQNAVKSLILAGDKHLHRLRFLQNSAKHLGLSNIQTICYDAEKALPFADEVFDSILVDAPCSGTGTIRSNPEIALKLIEKDLESLHEKQLRILANAAKCLKKQGIMVYSTCSLEPEENEQVISEFLDANKGFEKSELKLPKRFVTDQGFGRTYPHIDGTDGFFIAAIYRV